MRRKERRRRFSVQLLLWTHIRNQIRYSRCLSAGGRRGVGGIAMDSEMSVDQAVGALDDRRLSINRGSAVVGTPRVGSPGLGSGSPFGESMGPAASMLRDAIFRRTLMAADILAILAAFLLTIELSSR